MIMNMNFKINLLTIAMILALLFIAGSCERELSDDAVPVSFPKNGEVYLDGFSSGLEYLPFSGSFLAAFTVDEQTFQSGTSAMRFDVPNEGDPLGGFVGAIFPDFGGRDLTGFDALTFWAKASQAATINEIGFGIDFGENRHQVTLPNLQLTTNWRQYIIPIPAPDRLTQEQGLLWYAEGPENGNGYTFWLDEVEFVNLGTLGQPSFLIADGQNIDVNTLAGATVEPPSLRQIITLESGQDQTTDISAAYFDFESSDPLVATVNADGSIEAVGQGVAIITGSVDGFPANGSVAIFVEGAFVSAPEPTVDPSEVISIFSDFYSNRPVDYLNGFWAPFQTTLGGGIEVGGDNIIEYTDLNFVGIQFIENTSTIDISEMTHFHVDIQVREPVEDGDYIEFELLDAGPDDMLGTGNEQSGKIRITSDDLVNGEWFSVDALLTNFPGLLNRSNLAQIIIVSDATIENVYLDNMFFYRDPNVMPPQDTEPTVGAPDPSRDANNVISIFSDGYTNVGGTDFNPDWGQATIVTEESIDGNNTLVYSGLNFQGTQLAENLDVSGMEFLHLDYWSSNSNLLNIFLISPGPLETPVSLDVPSDGWNSIDIPLMSFSSVVNLNEVFQFKVDGNGDVYFDNIYFYRN